MSGGSVSSSRSQPVPPKPPLEHNDDDDHLNVSTPHMRGGKGESRSGSKARSIKSPQQQQQPRSRTSQLPRSHAAGGGGESRTTTIPSTSNSAAETGASRVAVGGDRVGGSSADSWRQTPSHAASSSPRTTPRPTKRQPTQQPPPPPAATSTPSFTDQIAQSAVSTTMELLKLATGVTLSTTGKLYAPSLQVTRTVLLPSIFAALVEYLGAVTPQRVQDWFRILSSSAYHITTVLTQEAETGQQFRRALQLFWYSVVECASSPATIQAVVDAVTCWVRLADAAHTPEFHAFLDQLGVAGCRIFDAASSGTTHQLAHNAASLAWATAELLSDPRTTCAVAEVTAYLCHALEMEHVHHREPHYSSDREHDDKSTSNSAVHRPRSWCERSRKRRVRDEQQKGTYQGAILLPHSQPPATVEEVILSSLGCEPLNRDDASDDDDDSSHDDNDDASIPSKVVCTPTKRRVNVNDEADVSSRHRDEDDESRGDDGSTGEHSRPPHSTRWYQKVKEGVQNDVNVSVLQQRIMGIARHERNLARDSRDHIIADGAPLFDGSQNVEDVGDFFADVNMSEALPRSAKRKRPRVELRMDENGEPGSDVSVNAVGHDDVNPAYADAPWPRSHHPERYDGETPVEHFYRVLDEVLALQQGNALQRIVVESKGSEAAPVSPRGRVSKSAPSFRDRVAKLRAEVEDAKKEKHRTAEREARRFGIRAYALLAGVLLALTTFAGFAAYGAYVLLSPLSRSALGKAESYAPRSRGPSELVVRVVREIVHVDREGKVLHSSTDGPFLAPDRIDRVANCIASEL